MENKVVVTLTGPSCSGKSTLERRLREQGFEAIISTTTRPRRVGEADGENYFFVNGYKFRTMIQAGELAEHVEFGGNLYGASVAEFERVFSMNKPVVIVVEPDGRKQIEAFGKTHGWTVIKVFVDGPPAIVADRFLRRVVEEVSSGGTIQPSVRRLVTMMTIEAEWRVEAYADGVYDFTAAHFGPDNEALVCECIRSMVASALTTRNWSVSGFAAWSLRA
jgi:guanylate kinase